jgi:phospholipase C
LADFGVYFEVTNNLGVPLSYLKSDLVDATYDGPSSILSDGLPHLVHVADPYAFRGAEGTVYFTAEIDGEIRQYGWYGTCPVWSTDNAASGPGVLRFNAGGHPLTATIAVDPSTPGWTLISQLIQHVFLLMLENRSFDHLLGFSGISGTDAATCDPTSVNGLKGDESNVFHEATYMVSAPADYVMPVDPGHEFTDVVTQLAGEGCTYPWGGTYPAVDDAGFVAAYAQSGGTANPGEIMKCYRPDQLPVLVALASEFALCDNWHASMPGPTWPNRFFSLAASSSGLDHSPSFLEILGWGAGGGATFAHGSIFEALTAAKGDTAFRIYSGDRWPMSWFIHGVHSSDVQSYDQQFAVDVASGDYPWAFTLIEPNYGDVIGNTYVGGTSEHPMDDVTHGEALIKSTYEAIRNSPLWNSSLLIVTWDEHGGFFDHDKPGGTVAPGDTVPGSEFNVFGFTFEQLGARVPAVIVSPLIARNLIDHRPYEHASIPATLEAIFGMPALTARDAGAASVTDLVTLTSPRLDCPTTLPNPAFSGLPHPRAIAFEAGAVPEALDMRPADVGNLPGFLGVALRRDLELDPEHRAETLGQFREIATRADAQAYLDRVLQKEKRLSQRDQ